MKNIKQIKFLMCGDCMKLFEDFECSCSYEEIHPGLEVLVYTCPECGSKHMIELNEHEVVQTINTKD